MTQENGSQVSTGEILAGCADSYSGPAELFRVDFELVNGSIRKRDLQRVAQWKLDVTDRQARALVSSYWARIADHALSLERAGINGLVAKVSSAAHELLALADRRDDARRENGACGGRPTKKLARDATEKKT